MKIVDGSEIIEFLEEKFTIRLPSEGVLAGQAVASAYFELNRLDFNPVYNDVDVFCYEPFYNRRFDYDNNNIDFLNSMKIRLINDYPDRIQIPRLSLELKHNYRIIDTTRQGIINKIQVSQSVGSAAIINGFDLNCVQIGVDLKTKKLHKTKEFNEYLNNGILKVVSYASPHHTAIRLMNKKGVSEKSDNIEKEMWKLGAFIELDNFWSKEDNEINGFGYFPYFGIKRFKDYEKMPELKKYFDVYAHKDFEMFQLMPKFKTEAKKISRYMDKNLKFSNGKTPKYPLSDKHKLYLVHAMEKEFFDKKEKDKTYFMNSLKMETLRNVFSKEQMETFSKEELNVMIKNVGSLSAIDFKRINILKGKTGSEILNLIENINFIFEENDYIDFEAKDLRENIIKDGNNSMKIKRVNRLIDFLNAGGDVSLLDKSHAGFLYKVTESSMMSSIRAVFSVKDEKINYLMASESRYFKDDSIKKLLEETVNSKWFKHFFDYNSKSG